MNNIKKRVTVFALSMLATTLGYATEQNWAAAAIAFKMNGDNPVNNARVRWNPVENATSYAVFRNGEQIGEVSGTLFEDYELPVGAKFTYQVAASDNGNIIGKSIPAEISTYMPGEIIAVYDNLNGKSLKNEKKDPKGFQVGKKFYQYALKRNDKRWTLIESVSPTGLDRTWNDREIKVYDNVNFEGIAFRLNPKTQKVILSAHYEDEGGYTAAKIFLAEITPGGDIEVGTQARPLGHDSRDQDIFVDDDNTAYLLSATNTNSDINIYRLDDRWTKPVELINTCFKGEHRETPAIIKHDGVYYFFSSKASGWYPSQVKYASSTRLDGEWSPLMEVGDASTFGTQFNNIRHGKDATGAKLTGYHWGAQYHHPDPAGNFPRQFIVTFNDGTASAEYFRYIEETADHDMIPVSMGRNFSLGKPVSVKPEVKGVASMITDGASLASSPMFKNNSPHRHQIVIDLEKEIVPTEILFSTNMVNGSETAYKYVIEYSNDGRVYKQLVNGNNNWIGGFQILPIENAPACRYIRLTVNRIVNLQKNNEAWWAEGIYEIAVLGKEV